MVSTATRRLCLWSPTGTFGKDAEDARRTASRRWEARSVINIAANKHADVTADVRGELREAILSELGVRGLGDAERLADALGVEALTARALLRRSSWSLEEAAWVVTTLSLPVIVTVKRAVE